MPNLPQRAFAKPLSMSEWVALSASDAGLEETQAWSVMTAALGLLHKHAEPAALHALYAVVDGAETLAVSEEARPEPGGGLFGGLIKSAGGLSGRAVSDAMGVMDRLKRRGLDRDHLKRLLPAARARLAAAAGCDPLAEAIRTVPGAGGLLGAD